MTQVTFRFVRQVFISSRTTSGHASWTCNHSHFVADANGEWIEKTYADGSKSYRMALDCNPRAVAKMREAA